MGSTSLFDTKGNLVEAEYNKIVDPKDRSQVYENVNDANAPIKKSHVPRFKQAMTRAIGLCRTSQGMDTSLERIFGTRTVKAKGIYKTAGDILEKLRDTPGYLDKVADTDYNLDDPETGLGGWASAGSMRVHFSPSTVIAKDLWSSALTLLHEACHLADSTVIDKGYYPPSTDQEAWAAYSESDKIENAAHFEEFPRRWIGRSVYGKKEWFRPGKTKSGGTVSDESKVKKIVSEYFRNAWDNSLDLHFELKDYKSQLLAGDDTNFKADILQILKLSRLYGLTIHEQALGNQTVTNLDITLSEGIVRGIIIMGSRAEKVAVPKIADPKDVPVEAAKIIEKGIASYSLLDDPKKDKKITDTVQTIESILDL